MKIFGVFLALLLVTLAWSAQISIAEKAVSDLEYQWAEAQRLGKPDVVGPMLADNFVNTDVDSATYGKAQLLSNLKGGKWEENGISDACADDDTIGARYEDAGGPHLAGDGHRLCNCHRTEAAWINTVDFSSCSGLGDSTCKSLARRRTAARICIIAHARNPGSRRLRLRRRGRQKEAQHRSRDTRQRCKFFHDWSPVEPGACLWASPARHRLVRAARGAILDCGDSSS